ncbi:MAG: hypothetical protein VKM97_05555 [Cyanobacteriota bacterium]|nr:hypothetical protein [Cyanobacteriota bacterium]
MAGPAAGASSSASSDAQCRRANRGAITITTTTLQQESSLPATAALPLPADVARPQAVARCRMTLDMTLDQQRKALITTAGSLSMANPAD